MTEPDPLALDRQVCFALAATSRSVIGLYRPILEPLGLTHPQYLVMLALWERSPRSASDISAALYLEPATLTPLLRRLESAGLVTRARSQRDERSLSVELTVAGRALRAKGESVPGQVLDTLGMRAADLEAIRDALTGLIAVSTAAQTGRRGAGKSAEKSAAQATGQAAAKAAAQAAGKPAGQAAKEAPADSARVAVDK